MMWHEDECICVLHYRGILEEREQRRQELAQRARQMEPEIPQELFEMSVEEIAQKVLDAYKKEHPIRVLGPRGAGCYAPSRPRLGPQEP
jgi:hypothetical protein